MTEETETLGVELGVLADGPAPAARLDINWTIRQGRSRLRRRRLSVLGGVTAVAVLASTLALVLPPGGRSSTAASPAVVAPQSVPAGSPVLVADTGHDPLTVEGIFGWLPEGFGRITYTMGSTGNPTDNSVTASGPQPPEAPPAMPTLRLKVYPPGQALPVGPLLTGAQQFRVEAPAVLGRSAYWLSTDPSAWTASAGDSVLRWETGDGRWAEMQSSSMAGAEMPDLLHRVAEAVRIGHWAVPLPFRVTDLPAGFTLAGADYTQGDTRLSVAWMASLTYAVGDAYLNTLVLPDVPDTVPSGLPPGAIVNPRTCVHAAGVQACTESPQGLAPYDSVGGHDGWLSRFTLFGTDQAQWTADVLG